MYNMPIILLKHSLTFGLNTIFGILYIDANWLIFDFHLKNQEMRRVSGQFCQFISSLYKNHYLLSVIVWYNYANVIIKKPLKYIP